MDVSGPAMPAGDRFQVKQPPCVWTSQKQGSSLVFVEECSMCETQNERRPCLPACRGIRSQPLPLGPSWAQKLA